MKFDDIVFEPHDISKGIKALLDFEDYSLSIIKTEHSYGGKGGLYEIATFDHLGEFVYLPGISRTDGVEGFLTEDGVQARIDKLFYITKKEPKQV